VDWRIRNKDNGMDIEGAPIVIEDNVWLGANVVVMPGVTIGKHSVVAAGSVVTKDVPPDTIVAGVPAKVVKKLDSEE
jgi:acetyltransferase-like isoleucine patch superfamily enzyme